MKCASIQNRDRHSIYYYIYVLFVCLRIHDVPARVVGACIRIYGTIAARAFVRVYINEFIIISFMRTHFCSVGLQSPAIAAAATAATTVAPNMYETMSCFVCGIRVHFFFASSFAVIREIKTIKSLYFIVQPERNANIVLFLSHFLLLSILMCFLRVSVR